MTQKQLKEEIASEFEIELEKLKDCKILYSNFTEDGYEGYAFILYEKGKKLYEVNGSHCSCYGFEDQWEPEPVTVKELKFRSKADPKGSCGFPSSSELTAALSKRK